jgi:predicted transcriptional regulator YdeE/DNA-binding transcriptional MerR regulator
MLKIGDFSKLAHVTIKTLRHYDRLGLLRPVWVDRYTGYRYYAIEQLPRLNRILALKDLGFSLSQIQELVQVELPAQRLRQLFDQKQRELQHLLAEEQARLKRVAERLRQIEQEGSLPAYEVTLKSIPAQLVAFRKVTLLDPASAEAELRQMRQEMSTWALESGLHSAGASGLGALHQWLVIHHEPLSEPDRQELELGLVLPEHPGARFTRRDSPFALRHLPALPAVASLLHLEGLSPLADASLALFGWADQNRYHVSGSLRELLLHDPSQPAAPIYTELQLPVESLQERKLKYLSDPNRKETEMEPKFVELPAFTVVGMRYYGKNQNQEISQMWGEFNQKCGQIQHISPNSPAYGVCITPPDATNGEFEYVASFAVDKVENVPPGMVVRQVPAYKYAVFTHLGPLDKLGATYDYIYHTWLPQSGYKTTGGIDFELYDEDFKDFAPDSRFYIYVPISN